MCYIWVEMRILRENGPQDAAVVEAEAIPDELAPPSLNFIAHLERERDSWLVGTAAAGTHPSSVLAKAAGYATMGAYRTALHRARRRMGVTRAPA